MVTAWDCFQRIVFIPHRALNHNIKSSRYNQKISRILTRILLSRKPGMTLRSLKIYALPDGREFVADALPQRRYGLIPVPVWGTYNRAEYTVNNDGRLLSKGAPTRWRIEHLSDTGRAVQYPRPSSLL
jgi:hypothetical protein